MSRDREYKGDRISEGPRVTRDGITLSPLPSQRLYNHSPDGFEWGYSGSGPAQLALGLILDATGDKDVALAFYQSFKQRFVANWPVFGWTIKASEIKAWLAQVGDEAAAVGS